MDLERRRYRTRILSTIQPPSGLPTHVESRLVVGSGYFGILILPEIYATTQEWL